MERTTPTGTRHLCYEHAGEYLDILAYQDVDLDSMYDIDYLVGTLDDILYIDPEVRYDGDPDHFEAIIGEAQVVVNAMKGLLE